MNVERLLDERSAAVLHCGWIENALAPASPDGRRAFEAWAPFMPGDRAAASARASAIERVANALSPADVDAVREALRTLPDISAAVARAAMGDALDDPAFYELLRFCDGLQVLDALVPPSMQKPARCEALSAALERGRHGKFAFYLDVKFDEELTDKRAALSQLQQQYDSARESLARGVRTALGRDETLEHEFIVMRDAVGTLPENVRVIREAPTYFLCELELDDRARAALSKRDAAQTEVSLAEERVRAGLSAVVAANVASLEKAQLDIGALDLLLAAVRFTQRHHCTAAEYVEDAACVEFDEGSFLPVAEALAREGREYRPVSLALRGLGVLTGPNMGGKTVALQTCGFLSILAAFGVPVPARKMRVALFARVAWIGIGLGETANELLSSFALEIVRLRDILACASGSMLLLADEFARTTSAAEATALSLALIERLRERGSAALIATHLSGVASEAGVPHFAVRGLRHAEPAPPAGPDAVKALEMFARAMDYRIDEVAAGDVPAGDAIRLAGILGMDGRFVDAAWQRLAGQKGR